MTPPVRRRNEQSRRAILDAALALLGETGYADLTVEAIAARAGVGKQTIYRWWRGKGAVILDALAEQVADAGAIALPDTGDLRADLRTVIRATVAEFADPRLSATTRALTIETLADDNLAEEVRDRLLAPQFEAVKARLRAGGISENVDSQQLVELLFGPIYYRWLLRTGPLDDAYADGLVDAALKTAGAGSETPRAAKRLRMTKLG